MKQPNDLQARAVRYSVKAVRDHTPINIKDDKCWCNQCCARRAYVAGFRAARRMAPKKGNV